MKGSEKVLTVLNNVLNEECMGFLLYFVHCKLWEHWGNREKYQIFKEKARHKKKYADKIIGRILSLEGVPLIKFENNIPGIMNVEEQFKLLLVYERAHRSLYLSAIDICEEAQDIGTKILIERFVPYVEKNIFWFESQLSQIGYIGVKAYVNSPINSQLKE